MQLVDEGECYFATKGVTHPMRRRGAGSGRILQGDPRPLLLSVLRIRSWIWNCVDGLSGLTPLVPPFRAQIRIRVPIPGSSLIPAKIPWRAAGSTFGRSNFALRCEWQ